jgi:hypothetical protein
MTDIYNHKNILEICIEKNAENAFLWIVHSITKLLYSIVILLFSKAKLLSTRIYYITTSDYAILLCWKAFKTDS